MEAKHKKILITLALRKGCKWKNYWYSLEWRNGNYVECFICGKVVIHLPPNLDYSEPGPSGDVAGRLIVSAIDQHGMQHLKDSNLLPFM